MVATAQLRAVADALDLESLFEAVGDPLDHVRDERPGEPVQGPMLAAVGGPRHDDLLADLLHADVAMDALGELALGSVDRDAIGPDRDRHA